MQFNYSLTRTETSENTENTKKVVSVCIFGVSLYVATGILTIPQLATSIMQQIDPITQTSKTTFSHTFTNEKYNYMSGVYIDGAGTENLYSYSMIFYDATTHIKYSIMGVYNTANPQFTLAQEVQASMLAKYGVDLTSSSNDFFLETCILEVR